MSWCSEDARAGVSVTKNTVRQFRPFFSSRNARFGPVVALALIAIGALPLIAQTTQSGSQSSSSAEAKDRFQLGGAQTRDHSANGQAVQCKKDENEKETWRPKDAVLVEDSAGRQSSPELKSAPDNRVSPAVGPAVGDPAHSSAAPIALSGPTITYSGGKLAIRARGVALSEILDAIKARTGVAVDYPPGGAGERVFVDIHLIPMQDALTQLLDGSRFNYVLALGSNPQVVKQIILSNKSGQNVASANPVSSQPGALEVSSSDVNSSEASVADQPDETPAVQSAPNTIPTIPASLGLSVTEEDLKKPTAQLLDELQKRQNRLLDAAAAKAAEAAQTSPQ